MTRQESGLHFSRRQLLAAGLGVAGTVVTGRVTAVAASTLQFMRIEIDGVRLQCHDGGFTQSDSAAIIDSSRKPR